MPDPDPPRTDAQELIRRAASAANQPDVSSILSKMASDDAQDEKDGIESHDSHLELSDSGFSSHLSSSLHRSPPESGPDSGDLSNPSNRSYSGGTLSENTEDADTTVQLSSKQLRALQQDATEVEEGEGLSSSEGGEAEHLRRADDYRPAYRPPMGLLHVFDDGLSGYEVVRIRRSPFVIGRLEGDFLVEHEQHMSRKHLRIDRVSASRDAGSQAPEECRWVLTDLHSRNGTFVRQESVVIAETTAVLIGGELIRFRLHEEDGGLTLLHQVPNKRQGQQHRVKPGRWLIGADQERCLPFLESNPFLDDASVQLTLDASNRWKLVDLDSTNGIWRRLGRNKQTPLENGSEFQAGEQRFRFTLP